MIMSFLVTTCSCITIAYSDDAYIVNNEDIIYTVERTIYSAHYEIATDQDIIFTKVFSKNHSTQQITLLFELQEIIYDCRALNNSIYLHAKAGLYRYSINGDNIQLLVEGIIKCFTMNSDNIFYCRLNTDTNNYQIIKCDLDGSNKILFAENVFADKITIVNDFLIYSDMCSVGKISSTNQVTYITNFEVPMPGGLVHDGGRHFVIDDKIIISGYAMPEEYKEYGRYPTIILDLNGKVVNIWENCYVHYITKVNDKIYASIDNMRNDIANTTASGGIYQITDDYKEKQLMPDNILQSWKIEKIVNESQEEYPDTIVVVILRENKTVSAAQYFSDLVTFDVSPTMENDRVLVPMRAIFEVLGATVEWDNDNQTVTAKKDDTEIILKIGSDVIYKNGKGIALDVPVKIVNNRTLVPIRAVSEGLGARVEWNEKTQAVLIWAEQVKE